jgi:hypothetical protein
MQIYIKKIKNKTNLIHIFRYYLIFIIKKQGE